MKTIEFTLENAHGLHARPAGLLVQTCNRFSSSVMLYKAGVSGSAKSILGIMKLAASKGDDIRIEIEGADEALASIAIQELIDRQFDE